MTTEMQNIVLTNNEIDLITTALNMLFHDSARQLESDTLGDMERTQLIRLKTESRKLMLKLL